MLDAKVLTPWQQFKYICIYCYFVCFSNISYECETKDVHPEKGQNKLQNVNVNMFKMNE